MADGGSGEFVADAAASCCCLTNVLDGGGREGGQTSALAADDVDVPLVTAISARRWTAWAEGRGTDGAGGAWAIRCAATNVRVGGGADGSRGALIIKAVEDSPGELRALNKQSLTNLSRLSLPRVPVSDMWRLNQGGP